MDYSCIIPTIAFPDPKIREDYGCGAFYNLYKVIGCYNSNGQPATDTDSEYERAEMIVARIRMNYCTPEIETVSISEMCAEVDEFLRNEFKIDNELVYRKEYGL